MKPRGVLFIVVGVGQVEEDVVKEEAAYARHEEAVAPTRLRKDVAPFHEFGGEQELVELADVVSEHDDVNVVKVVGQFERFGRFVEQFVGDVVAGKVFAFAHELADVVSVGSTVPVHEIPGEVLLQTGPVGAEPPGNEAGPRV